MRTCDTIPLLFDGKKVGRKGDDRTSYYARDGQLYMNKGVEVGWHSFLQTTFADFEVKPEMEIVSKLSPAAKFLYKDEEYSVVDHPRVPIRKVIDGRGQPEITYIDANVMVEKL